MHPILEEISKLHGLSEDRFKLKLLRDPFNFNMPLKPGAEHTGVRWVPGTTFDEGDCFQGQKVMLVGDRPSYNDACWGFDKAFRVLHERWDALGIDFKPFYLTSLVKFWTTVKFSTLSKYHVNICKDIFDLEYDILKPDYIIVMGAQACKELIGQSFTACSGAEDLTYRDSRVIVIQHPHKLAKSPYLQDQIIDQLEVFNRMYKGASRDEDLNYSYIDTLDGINELVEDLLNRGVTDMGVDFEWAGDSVRRGAKLRSFQISPQPMEAYYISFSKPGGDGPFGLQDVIPVKDGMEALRPLLCRPDVTLNGHHLRSELEWFLHYDLDLTAQCLNGVDTMFAYHELNADSDGVGLEKAAMRLTDMRRWDKDLHDWLKENDPKFDKEKRGFATVPEEILFPYGCADVDAEQRIVPVLKRMLSEHRIQNPYTSVLFNTKVETLWDHYRCVSRLNIPSILHMEQTGIKVDRERVIEYSDFMHIQQKTRIEELQKLVGWDKFTPNRTNLLWLLYKIREGKPGQKIPESTKTLDSTPIRTTEKPPRRWVDVPRHELSVVKPATDELTLKTLKEQYLKKKDTDTVYLLDKLIEVNAISSVISNFVPKPDKNGTYKGGILGSTEEDGRIYYTLLPTTKTARFRASKFNVLGMLNKKEFELVKMLSLKPLPVDSDDWTIEDLKQDGYLPNGYHRIRSCLTADPGWVWLSADWKQAELFAMSRIAKDQAMIDILSDPKRDIHSEVAVRAFRLSCDPADVKKHYTRYRIIAKAVIFGLAYQRSAKAIALELQSEGVDCSIEEAQALIDAILDAFPMLRVYFQQTTEFMEKHGFVETAWGRIRKFFTSDDRAVQASNRREAINTRIQGTVADCLIVATFMAIKLLEQMNMKTRVPVNFHDALEFVGPPEEVGIVRSEIIPAAMIESVKIPEIGLELMVDVEEGFRWG